MRAKMPISLLRSHILHRKLDDATLRIIESVMDCKAVESSMEVRLSLQHLMRSESVAIMREGAQKPVERTLLDLDFLVRAFALLGDFESCLAVRYEALIMREFKSPSYLWLEVQCSEWLNFAEQSLDHGFHSIAKKACENAVSCIHKKCREDGQEMEHFEEIIEKIKAVKDCIMAFAAARSVQAQAAKYSKSKPTDNTESQSSICKRTQVVASTLFRNGIKNRNLQNLNRSQRLIELPDEPNTGEI